MKNKPNRTHGIGFWEGKKEKCFSDTENTHTAKQVEVSVSKINSDVERWCKDFQFHRIDLRIAALGEWMSIRFCGVAITTIPLLYTVRVQPF